MSKWQDSIVDSLQKLATFLDTPEGWASLKQVDGVRHGGEGEPWLVDRAEIAETMATQIAEVAIACRRADRK